MTFSKSEISALNIIRWLSVLMIFSCHILQGLNSKWAFILNVGVQIFFFLSGFLYGAKGISNYKIFYIKRFSKIYVPYFIALSLFLLLQFFMSQQLPVKDIVGYYLCVNGLITDNLTGLGHLWFIPVIFICYLLLPIFDYCIRKKAVLTICVFACMLGLAMVVKPNTYFLWIGVYYIGYLNSRFPILQKYCLSLSLVACIVLFTIKYMLNISILGSAFNPLIHATGGCLLFLAGYNILAQMNINQQFAQNSRWGYFVYLTHFPFIIGPLSVLHLSTFLPFNILLILLLTVIASLVVEFLSRLLTKQ